LIRTRHVVVPCRQHIFNKWLYRNCTSAVISVSKRAQESLGKLLDFYPEERKPVIYSAVDTERFSPQCRSEELRRQLGVEERGLLIGLIARFQRIKGQRQFLQSARLVLEKTQGKVPIKFLLAGRNATHYREKYLRLARHLGIQEQVEILGEVENIPQLVASLDIGVVASLGSEGSSRITLEYLAAGVPVVATRVGGIPELITHQQTGLLVEAGNVEQMAEAIVQLIISPSLRQDLINAGLKSARDFFSPQRFCKETTQLYQLLLIKKTGDKQ
ncbi:MAG: glycosyltransferase family 4 protein, partial [Candidatus Sumerlaeia bacterium]|nr:glycosyltransferase family 4 protein [Candidatus Sumerlaeia bacterium]